MSKMATFGVAWKILFASPFCSFVLLVFLTSPVFFYIDFSLYNLASAHITLMVFSL